MAAPLVLLGASGNTADIIDIVTAINEAAGSALFEPAAVLADDHDGTHFHGVPVRGGLKAAAQFPDALFVNGIGSENTHWRRDAIVARAGIAPDRFATIVHPRADVFASARIGRGCVLYPNVVVGARAELQDHVLILANSVVNHDCVVGTHSCLASGVLLSGNARIAPLCYVGAGANVLPGRRIGDRALVGAGAVVTRDLPPDSVSAGVPARVMRNRQGSAQA